MQKFIFVAALVLVAGCSASVQTPAAPVEIQATVEQRRAMWHEPDGETLPMAYPTNRGLRRANLKINRVPANIAATR